MARRTAGAPGAAIRGVALERRRGEGRPILLESVLLETDPVGAEA